MRVFLRLGKLLALLFWGLVLVNLFASFAKPFGLLLQVAGALVLLMHGLELRLFKTRLENRPRLWLELLQVLVFGVFHLYGRPAVTTAPARDA